MRSRENLEKSLKEKSWGKYAKEDYMQAVWMVLRVI